MLISRGHGLSNTTETSSCERLKTVLQGKSNKKSAKKFQDRKIKIKNKKNKKTHRGLTRSGFFLDSFNISSTKKSGPQREEPIEKDSDGSQSREIPRYRVNFAEMQRMHLRKLQIRLVKHAVYMYKDGREAENSTWEKDLAEYSRLQTVTYVWSVSVMWKD